MGNERLFLVEFQLEVIAQELCQAGLDFLGLGLRPGEPEEVIVCVPGVAEPPEAGITGIPAGQAPRCWRSSRTAARSPRDQARRAAFLTSR